MQEQLTQSLTVSEIQELERFAAEVAQGLDAAEEDFEPKRRIVDMLNVRVEFTVEDDHEVATRYCEFGLGPKRLIGPTGRFTQPDTPSPAPESPPSASSPWAAGGS